MGCFVDVSHVVFPKNEVQRCIVHQIRYTTKFVYYEDMKPFIADLKKIYQVATEDAALLALDEKWRAKYAAFVESWKRNWTQLFTYMKYLPEICKMIYTTNSIEKFNCQLHKVTKSKTIFPNDDAFFKMLYLATMDITKKWSGCNREWNSIMAQLSIQFADRVSLDEID